MCTEVAGHWPTLTRGGVDRPRDVAVRDVTREGNARRTWSSTTWCMECTRETTCLPDLIWSFDIMTQTYLLCIYSHFTYLLLLCIYKHMKTIMFNWLKQQANYWILMSVYCIWMQNSNRKLIFIYSFSTLQLAWELINNSWLYPVEKNGVVYIVASERSFADNSARIFSQRPWP